MTAERAALCSLNDVVSELVAGLAADAVPTKGWAYTVVETLAEHTRELNGEPEITTDALNGWEGEE